MIARPSLIPVFILLCLLSSCNYDRYRYDFFEGNWVLINYLDTVQKYRSVAKADHLSFQEMVLKRHVDSIFVIDNGTEPVLYPFKRKASNNIVIEHYAGKDPLDIHISEEANYLKYKKNGKWFVFVKPDNLLIDSSETPEWPVSGQRVINSIVLGGIYKLKNQAAPVQLYTSGKITGLNDVDFYQVCIGGDCRSFYDGDIVYMGKETKGGYYTWEWAGSELHLYKLLLISLPDEKPYYKKGALFLNLHKLK